MRTKAWIIPTLFVLILSSCNLPASGEVPEETEPAQAGADVNVVGTSVALTTSAMMTEPSETPAAATTEEPTTAPTDAPAAAPTQCTPTAKATVDSNIRSGPGTVYDIVGFLPLNGVATVAGKNDAGTWWYILLPGKTSDYGWISGTIVETSCLPASVQVVAAPPTPVQPTEVADDDDNGGSSSGGGTPDLVAAGMQYYPNPPKKNDPISIMVKVKNNGDGQANNFAVTFLFNQDEPVCTWSVDSLAAGASTNLECEFSYDGNASNYWTRLVVDSGGQISESNEGNNNYDVKVPFSP